MMENSKGKKWFRARKITLAQRKANVAAKIKKIFEEAAAE